MNRECGHIKSILLLGDDKLHYDISVVIPTYKRNESLIHLVTAICEQQCDGFEFNIVITDNSDIYTTQLVEQLGIISKQYNKNILYYKNEQNIGMYPNWNRVIELANCDYALMIHSDDLIIEGCLQYMHDSLSQLPDKCALMVDIHWLGFNDYNSSFVEERCRLTKMQKRLLKILQYDGHSIHKVVAMDIICNNVQIAPPCLMISKKLFCETGGWHEYIEGWPGDREFLLNLATMGCLYSSDYKFAVKRQRNTSITPPLPPVVSIPYIFVQNCMLEKYINFFMKPMARYIIHYKSMQLGKIWGLDDNQLRYLSNSLVLSPRNDKIYNQLRKLFKLFYMLR